MTDDTARELVIPEDLGTLNADELKDLHDQATSTFDSVFGDGAGLSSDDLEALSALTEAIEALAAEQAKRDEEQSKRDALAAELSAKARPLSAETTDEAPAAEEESDEEADEEEEPAEDEGAADVVAASASKEIRVNLSGVRRKAAPPKPTTEPQTIKDVLLSAGVPNLFSAGEGIDWIDAARSVDRRLTSFNQSQYEAAHSSGRHVREQLGVAMVRKPLGDDMKILSDDYSHVDKVLKRAQDETRLPGGSLVASGGWCAPSETIYDLCELESRDGLFSLPEVAVTRGGLKYTAGPSFAAIYAAHPGFSYTEAEDESGDYDGQGAGSKPTVAISCPSFTDVRLSVRGLSITAGLLEQRGYPELIARTLSGALIAHDHRMSGAILGEVVTGSEAVTMTTGTLGTTAPLLTAIELQVEHMRYVNRLARGVSLEAVFPFWVKGAIRSDLALRNGVDMLSVADSQIDAWFAERGVSPQYVYNWQDLTGDGHNFKVWPSTVQFLLYPAGTWVKGGSEVITLDTLFDSTLLGTNDFVALFTEESYLTAKMCTDSRVITVPVDSTGTTGGSIIINGDGTEAPEAEARLDARAQSLEDALAGVVDRTDPVAGTMASSFITATGFTLTVSGASDAGVGLDAEPYRFSTDGGVTWTEWQTAAVKVYTGLTAETLYHTRHEVRDAEGNISTGAVVNVTTAA